MRKLIVYLTFLILILPNSLAWSSPTNGASCPKVGVKKSINEKVFTCQKQGNKKVWIQTTNDKRNPKSKTDDLSLQYCEVPLERKLTYICWQDKNQPDAWRLIPYDSKLHTPFKIPANVNWRRINSLQPGGRAQFQQQAKDGIAKLASELDYYWIEVEIEGGKRVTSAIWSPKNAVNKPLIIFFHGTGGLIYHETEMAANLAKEGYVVATPLWYGERTGFLAKQFPADSLPGVFEDSSGPTWKGANLELAYEMLPVISAIAKQPQVNPQKIILAGQSRGATLALIIGSTTNGINAVLANVSPFLPPQLNNPMLRGEVWEVLPKSIIGNLKIPVLVIGATEDDVVPPISTEDFFDFVKIMKYSNIQTTWIQGKHTLGYPTLNPESSKKVRQAMIDFLSSKL